MIGIIPGQRNGKIIAKTAVCQIIFLFCLGNLQLLSSFHDLKDQFLIISALLAAKILNMLYTGRLHRLKSVTSVGLFDQSDQVIPDLHFLWKDIFHPCYGLFLLMP